MTDSKILKVHKTVTFDFLSLVANAELLFEKEINWANLKANQKIVDACWEFSLAGCELVLKTNLDSEKVYNFIETNGFPDIKLLSD